MLTESDNTDNTDNTGTSDVIWGEYIDDSLPPGTLCCSVCKFKSTKKKIFEKQIVNRRKIQKKPLEQPAANKWEPKTLQNMNINTFLWFVYVCAFPVLYENIYF